ncbi:MAG TPA: SLC13 family permease [Haliscomenobacter sp.]|uniref:GntP family permease n=1 Tax=Haliscomenobacter sp. TaxID=2717303 RepID=UPI002D085253|nr:SLC13 family permease [Haliscomenobacter sp.]HOY17300.1 SLC13 family permease [Haliscomenobacter sp.]HPH19237.1 SLC13 family permease [Haliscomenobacter sp.]
MLDPIAILAVGIILVVGGIIGFKLHPFLALLLGAFVVACLTPSSQIEQFGLSKGMDAAAALAYSKKSIGERIATEFGNTCAKIGILIAMAAIIGKCMLESGAAERIIRALLKLTGIKKAPFAFLFGSFFLGIPVFFDTVIFLMIPLAKAMTLRIGKDYLLLILCIMSGAAMANSLVPPAPGPLFLIGEMGIPIGLMMMCGIVVGLFTISAGYLFSVWANKKMPIELRDSLDAKLEDLKAISAKEDKHLPGLLVSLLPVLIPLVLIITDTIMSNFMKIDPSSTQSSWMNPLYAVVRFLGDKNIAIILGGVAALLVMAKNKKQKHESLTPFVQTALMSGGGIIMITASGGAFGGALQQTGISAEIAHMTAGYQMALIPMAFFISAVVRTAQGSATVALITASGILSGMANQADLAFNPVYIGLAIGCGSKLVPWMNDAGFWIFCKLSDLTEKEALKTISPLLVVMGLTGLVVILIGAKLFPLI